MEFEDDAGDYPVDIDGADDDDADGEDEETIVVCVRQEPLGIELKDGVTQKARRRSTASRLACASSS
ncbi:hypothetical protein DIPPA_03266 [Diplonema papillatum]|nr:hypothetical protein DIPPA_03266 [Diplonema papillatum]